MKVVEDYTVTIGISAFNEEANIQHLLRSILAQKEKSFILERVILICDGCTDKTEARAKEIARKYPIIAIVADDKRIGKIERLNQMYRLNTSKILVIFDADILLDNDQVIATMIKEFNDPQVALVAANKLPVKARGLTEKLINHWYNLWYEIRKDLNHGDNVHNFSSCAFAIRGSFAQKIHYPKDIYPITKFTYFSAIEAGLKVKFAKEALVLFRSPGSIHDYILQTKRFRKIQEKNASYYGDWIYNVGKIPLRKKIFVVAKMAFINPVNTLFAISFRLVVEFFSLLKPIDTDRAIWREVKSTKKLL